MIPNKLNIYLPLGNISLMSSDIYKRAGLLILPESVIDKDELVDIYYRENPYYDMVRVGDFFDNNVDDIKKKNVIVFFAYDQKQKLFGFPPFSPWNKILKNQDIDIIDDFAISPQNIDVEFKGSLYKYQEDAILDWRSNKGTGIIQGYPGSGKTVVGINIFTRVKRRAVVLVHTKELMYQWRDRILTFTSLNEDDIGLVGDSLKKPSNIITIALFQSLWRNYDIVDNLSEAPLLIVDEAHRVGAPTFMNIVSRFKSKFRLALTATPYRTDKLDFIIYWYLGNKMIKMDSNPFYGDVFLLRTGFRIGTIPSGDYYAQIGVLKRNLCRNPKRINMIVDIIKKFHKDRNIIVTVGTKKEVDKIFDILKEYKSMDVSRLHSGMPKKERGKALLSKVIVATTEIIKEGIDIPEKDMLLICSPFQSRTLLEQLVGRIMRPEGKKPIIIDLIDESYPPEVLEEITKNRIRKYQRFGHKVVGYFDNYNDIFDYCKFEGE